MYSKVVYLLFYYIVYNFIIFIFTLHYKTIKFDEFLVTMFIRLTKWSLYGDGIPKTRINFSITKDKISYFTFYMCISIC